MSPNEHIVYHRDFWNGKDSSYIVMEVCKGSLVDLKDRYGDDDLPRRLLLEIFLQIAEGVEWLHNKASLCHRDLKPENG